MQQQSVITGPTPELHVEIACDGKIQGWDKDEVLAESPDGLVEIRQVDNVVTVFSPEDCAVYVPMGTQLRVKSIGGDGRLKNLSGSVNVGSVGGDCVVRNVAEIGIDDVGGDLSARGVSSRLTVRNVGGDCSGREMGGVASVGQVGGDLDVEGAVLVSESTSVGGDAAFWIEPRAGEHHRVSAGGDVRCVARPGSNAVLRVTDSRGRREMRLGEGSGEYSITCGGAIVVASSGGEAFAPGAGAAPFGPGKVNVRVDVGDFGGDMAKFGEAMGRWGAQFGEAMGRWGEEFGQNMAGKGQNIGEKAARRAQRAAERAARHARHASERAEREAARAGQRRGWGGFGMDFGAPPQAGRTRAPQPEATPTGEPVSDDERVAILRMLEQKKITAEQAEQLLRALG